MRWLDGITNSMHVSLSELWEVVLEKTLESLLDNTEIKSVNQKEMNPEYSLEGLMLNLKLQHFDYLI